MSFPFKGQLRFISRERDECSHFLKTVRIGRFFLRILSMQKMMKKQQQFQKRPGWLPIDWWSLPADHLNYPIECFKTLKKTHLLQPTRVMCTNKKRPSYPNTKIHIAQSNVISIIFYYHRYILFGRVEDTNHFTCSLSLSSLIYCYIFIATPLKIKLFNSSIAT